MSGRVHLADDRVPGRPVLVAAAVVVVFSVLLCGWAALIHTQESTKRAAGIPVVSRPVGPTLSEVRQTLILDERPGRILFQMQRERLGRFGWVDRQAGTIHIPIEAAMDLAAGGGGP